MLGLFLNIINISSPKNRPLNNMCLFLSTKSQCTYILVIKLPNAVVAYPVSLIHSLIPDIYLPLNLHYLCTVIQMSINS